MFLLTPMPKHQSQQSCCCLGLVATRCTTATSLLELAALGAHIWGGIAGSASGATAVTSPVADRLASEAKSTEEHAAGSSGEELSELVEGDDLTTIGQDASASAL